MIEVSTAERRYRSARPCPLPPASQLHRFLSQPGYTDSFKIAASPEGMSILEIYVALLGHIPGAFKHLLVLRSLVVRPFGIGGVTYGDLTAPPDTRRVYAPGDKVGRWTLYSETRDEIITGRNDKHLDFRVSVFRDREATRERVVLSTSAQVHNTFGRAYLSTILPFHRFGVSQLLVRAARAGRLGPANPAGG